MSLFIYHVDEFVGKAFEIVRCLVAFTATAGRYSYGHTHQPVTNEKNGDEAAA